MDDQTEAQKPVPCCAAMAAHIRQTDGYEGIVLDPDGSFNVWGCCGGGCYVLSGVRFCPFCGVALRPRVQALRGS